MSKARFGGHRATEAPHFSPTFSTALPIEPGRQPDENVPFRHARVRRRASLRCVFRSALTEVMDVTKLSYEKMVEDALRGVLRQALKITEAQGLPGSHHFYITFDTTHPGVKIADTLKAQHPTEMTIVLQHQFWDLKVAQDTFEITLD